MLPRMSFSPAAPGSCCSQLMLTLPALTAPPASTFRAPSLLPGSLSFCVSKSVSWLSQCTCISACCTCFASSTPRVLTLRVSVLVSHALPVNPFSRTCLCPLCPFARFFHCTRPDLLCLNRSCAALLSALRSRLSPGF